MEMLGANHGNKYTRDYGMFRQLSKTSLGNSGGKQ